MTSRLFATPRTGPTPGQPGAEPMVLPLAGSGTVWFDQVETRGPDGEWEIQRACDLGEASKLRLSRRRADICGLSLERPRIMGILNVTPDSFSDGGDLSSVKAAVLRAQAMAQDADILDIGGESTRPGAREVPEAAEIARVAPVIRAIREAGVTTPISIDTRKAGVARAALEAGADMVNDVSALSFDADLAALVAERGVPICLMHAQGDPATMQKDPHYGNVLLDVYDYLAERVGVAVAAGIARDRIITDPGIGFGKTQAHNLRLLRQLALFHDLGLPVLLGASRKKFIGSIGRAQAAKDRMPGSLAVALHAAAQGAQIIRVHDVAETRQALALFAALNPQ